MRHSLNRATMLEITMTHPPLPGANAEKHDLFDLFFGRGHHVARRYQPASRLRSRRVCYRRPA